ncbi:hypothetical protein GQ43DRAFT_157382 [Delitschia confertaspora ATCC 74209]|uniref:Uncharacterized protein n=1 Tax=Delitschia confertaspora ATCC 74209 TaxID=1513339 RepID=A0A9P4JFI3_9PLEO|nr:hypothetical protein GQ43DRAFT_157382 [Delitschia confertaspora ATCC 74209]
MHSASIFLYNVKSTFAPLTPHFLWPLRVHNFFIAIHAGSCASLRSAPEVDRFLHRTSLLLLRSFFSIPRLAKRAPSNGYIIFCDFTDNVRAETNRIRYYPGTLSTRGKSTDSSAGFGDCSSMITLNSVTLHRSSRCPLSIHWSRDPVPRVSPAKFVR